MPASLIAISVVIPLYNKSAHILDTLHTVLNQTYAPHEIIVVDDGSTDDGAKKVAELSHPKVRLITQKNAGVSAARNTGITSATAEFIALLDADDQWSPHFLEEIASLIGAYPEAGMFATNYQYKMGDNSYITPKLNYRFCPQKAGLFSEYLRAVGDGDLPLTMSSLVIRQSLFQAIGGFPVGEPMGEDQDFLFRAALHKPIAYTPQVLAFYVCDSENRACVRNLPIEECPFSQRLGQLVNDERLSLTTRVNLQRCRAAHILHLVRRNYFAGRIEVAERLLSNESCCAKPLHHWLWWGRVQVRKLVNSTVEWRWNVHSH